MKQKKPDQRHIDEFEACRQPRHPADTGADVNQALWSIGALVAFAIILGVTFYGINASDTQTAASPPANSPALAGDSSPAQTTGQGGSNENIPVGEIAR